ncbi:cytochrome b [Cupriavidus sp. BIS7]|uniref:cytochrome b n=1 Tax=Cupriavidus sp. BIS7 TaxID=1217718 RepID=UPI000A2F6F0D|nr:cytochrome b [Cupriavidus sp. BIS7]
MPLDPKYSFAMRALHWLVFLGAAIAVVAVELTDFFPKGSATRSALMNLHKSAGLSVLALMVLRLLARVSQPVPAPPPGGSRLMERAAGATHLLLYVLMLGMPVLGVLASAWRGRAVPFFGLEWTLPIAQNKALSDLAMDLHRTGATFVYIFVGLHAAAALWHQFVLKDRLLRRML